MSKTKWRCKLFGHKIITSDYWLHDCKRGDMRPY